MIKRTKTRSKAVKALPTKRRVGVYALGPASVELWVDDETASANFSLFVDGELGKLPRIRVGTRRRTWHGVFETMMHEVVEMAMVQVCCRWAPNPDYATSNAGYLFVVNHEQFSDVVSRAAEFIADAGAPLLREFKRSARRKKSKGAL
jgi:hypothetical protein